jgi:hypothetical protein
MSVSFAVVFLYGAYVGQEVTFIIRVLKRQLVIKRAPDVQILSLALLFFGVIFIVVFAALVIVLAGGIFLVKDLATLRHLVSHWTRGETAFLIKNVIQ